MIREDPSGWWLPKSDTYFAQFVEGPAPKRNGFMREHLLEAFKHVRSWDVAVDVGAHVGFWCFDLAQRFRDVFAYEATPENYACLARNLAEFDNVHAYNVAVGDQAGRCRIKGDERRPGNTGSNYIMPDDEGDVQVVCLDQQEIPKCDLLKIDVEGYELNVLRGASWLIKAHRPVISMECTDSKFRGRYAIPEGSAERWLRKRGYRVVADMRPDKVFVWQG